MSYIRNRETELTGYQEGSPWIPEIDLQCDFVMVYGIGATMPERIKKFREKGYVVHLMTGSAWGEYQDYLYGKFDGRTHWDESQMQRNGDYIQHGKDVPYMVPTVAFSDYLTEKLKIAVDLGVEALHLEEPEFWDYGGYSEAFQREYELYYHEKWQPPHTGLDVRYKSSKLKSYLYARTLARMSSSLKEYAMVKYNRVIRFYVPTHSLVNYTQWKIMSPEAALIDIPSIDGYIAQIWTGTSRSGNAYAGVMKERTFETSFLEYGIMQELVKGTGRKMWFLHDPIEDWPEYTWEDYRYNYLKTAVASLLHPMVHNYEICPWPNRVFTGVYPKVAGMGGGTIGTDEMNGAKKIPESYSTLLSSMVQLFGDMDKEDFSFEGVNSGVGILMSDSGLFQRSFPDGIVNSKDSEINKTHLVRGHGELNDKLDTLARRMHKDGDCADESRAILKKAETDDNMLLEFIETNAFPNFFGMALPLLKYGLPVRPVQLENVRRFPGYLDDYANLILSYEYMKPEAPDINNAFATWVREGGTLIYLGDGSDPYHNIKGWWNTGKANYKTPSEHLFKMLGLPTNAQDGVYEVGKGHVAIWNIAPSRLCLTAEIADQYRAFVKEIIAKNGSDWEYTNQLTMRRGNYIISAVMDESITDKPKVLNGLFADMLENDYKIITQKVIAPDENAILFDFANFKETAAIVGCSARVFSLDCNEKVFIMNVKAAAKIHAFIRIRLPKAPKTVTATNEKKADTNIKWEWNEPTQTLLISYQSENEALTIAGEF